MSESTLDKIHTPGELDQLVKDSAFLKKCVISGKEVYLPVPDGHVEILPDSISEWLNGEPDLRFRALKKKLAENIHTVSYEEFIEALHVVVEKVNPKLLPGDYAVLWDYKDHASKRWVFETARCDLQKQPQIESYFTQSLENKCGNPTLQKITDSGIDTFVIFDDGVYSGEQMINRIIRPVLSFYSDWHPEKRPKIIIAVPYVTNRFLLAVTQAVKQGTVEVVYKEIMPELSEILTKEEWDLLDLRNGRLNNTDDAEVLSNATLHLFDHKQPDDHSFSGEVAKNLRTKRIIIPPYKREGSDYFLEEGIDFRAYYDPLLQLARTETSV